TGTLHVTVGSQPLMAEFRSPCDFIHFHVSNEYLQKLQRPIEAGSSQSTCDLNDLIICHPLVESMGKTLLESGKAGDNLYAQSVGQTLVMYLARRQPASSTVNALPKWRLKRVQEYIESQLGESITLGDLAKVAGLSRMHFAAQFRAATGYRP